MPPKDEGGAPTARRDLLLQIQARAQQKWEAQKVFESSAPDEGESNPGSKFFGTFPFPYMNGLLHLGHAFSLSKLEFACAYHRLTGKRVLFPQGFHCTGMPIKACADKLDRELALYGTPPVFPDEEAAEVVSDIPAEVKPGQFVAKKSKAAAKKGPGSTQWAILKMSGIPEEDIPLFRDSDHWLRYFPPMAERDMRAMGCGVDWRRSFITTDRNPYYDAFVRWQFQMLRKQGRVVKDKRLSVYSPKDGQPCADHDRASGEGVNPQDYTLVKMEALELPGPLAALEGKGRVFLMAATLRPETMYGQTNCWVLPEGAYSVYQAAAPGEMFVMSSRAARNLAFQDGLAQAGEPVPLLTVTGRDLMGVPLKAPNSPHKRIFVLPLLTISMGKGTGVVTSVPSDSPDDYRALQDLKEKAPLRAKFVLKDEWVLPFEVIPIVHIPGFGDRAAEKVCTDLKISSQNDTKKLAEAKNMVYLKGFTDGVMLVGPHAGKKVSEVKAAMKEALVAAGEAICYSEPEKLVVSRSGDECVVALTDQWYLTYGEDDWLAATRQVLEGMNLYAEEARHGFEHTLGWLRQWACSRSFGLGTRLPWDPQYLIESLSDSTIYMAYYTVAHILQAGNMFGAGGGPIAASDMTPDVWDYIYMEGAPQPSSSAIPAELLHRMQREFKFWYPMDLRVSGKDLIQNHLTFCLYNHAAVWAGQPDRMPRAYRANGHLLLNAEKMSKSTGNFKTLEQAIAEYSADAMRVALADAGDALDDANFEVSVANATVLRLTRELAFIDEVLAAVTASKLRSEISTHFVDRAFENEMNIAVHATRRAYEGLLFREALKAGYYELQDARDRYRLACGPEGMRQDLALRYIEVSTLLVTPIAPHWAEEVWSAKLQKPGCVITAGWPAAAEPDFALQASSLSLEKWVTSTRSSIQKAETAPKAKKGAPSLQPPKVLRADVYVSSMFRGWQGRAMISLAASFDGVRSTFSKEASSEVMEQVRDDPGLAGLSDKDLAKAVMPFVQFHMKEAQRSGKQALDVKLPFDEAELLRENTEYLLRSLKLAAIEVHSAEGSQPPSGAPPNAAERLRDAVPGTPVVLFSS